MARSFESNSLSLSSASRESIAKRRSPVLILSPSLIGILPAHPSILLLIAIWSVFIRASVSVTLLHSSNAHFPVNNPLNHVQRQKLPHQRH